MALTVLMLLQLAILILWQQLKLAEGWVSALQVMHLAPEARSTMPVILKGAMSPNRCTANPVIFVICRYNVGLRVIQYSGHNVK